MGTATLNELRQREDDPSKEAEVVYAIHILQIFLGSPNFNILPFGLTFHNQIFGSENMASIREMNLNLILTLSLLINNDIIVLIIVYSD